MKLNCNSFFDGDFDYINLNDFYLQNKILISDTKNPALIQAALNSLNKNTFGGWAEDRKDIWAGTYMDETKAYVHLGIDINIQAGTPVKCPFDAVIIQAFSDLDTKIGWGGRLILARRTDVELKLPLLVLGHLNPKGIVDAAFKKYFDKGEILGQIGTWPKNGNTFHHLHVQAIKKMTPDFDGYGFYKDLIDNPNPFTFDFSS